MKSDYYQIKLLKYLEILYDDLSNKQRLTLKLLANFATHGRRARRHLTVRRPIVRCTIVRRPIVRRLTRFQVRDVGHQISGDK